MDNIDKRESRAEYRNSRQSSQGKGDHDRTTHGDYAGGELWCDHGKMRDKCTLCKTAGKVRCRGCQGVEFKVTVKDSHTQHECKKCKRVYCLFGVKGS